MAFNRKTWKDTIAEFPNKRVLTNVTDGSTSTVTVTRSVGTVSQEGDAWNAENMNDLEGRIEEEFDDLNSNLTDLIVGSIPIGDTSITLTSTKITTDSIIDIYFRDKVLAPTNVTVTNGQIVIEINAQDTITEVGVRAM